MSHEHSPRLGFLEVAGIGLTAGVVLGSGASLAGVMPDTLIPWCAAALMVATPALWSAAGFSIGWARARLRRARAATPLQRLVA